MSQMKRLPTKFLVSSLEMSQMMLLMRMKMAMMLSLLVILILDVI